MKSLYFLGLEAILRIAVLGLAIATTVFVATAAKDRDDKAKDASGPIIALVSTK